MAERWDSLVAELEYPTRRLALKVLYHLILSWMDGDRTLFHEDRNGLEALLSTFSSEVCKWLIEHPKATERCPTLVEMGLNTPRLIDDALMTDG